MKLEMVGRATARPRQQSLQQHLSTTLLLVAVGSFLAGTAVWVAALFRHFRRPR
jgi:hypothetical protein